MDILVYNLHIALFIIAAAFQHMSNQNNYYKLFRPAKRLGLSLQFRSLYNHTESCSRDFL